MGPAGTDLRLLVRDCCGLRSERLVELAIRASNSSGATGRVSQARRSSSRSMSARQTAATPGTWPPSFEDAAPQVRDVPVKGGEVGAVVAIVRSALDDPQWVELLGGSKHGVLQVWVLPAKRVPERDGRPRQRGLPEPGGGGA